MRLFGDICSMRELLHFMELKKAMHKIVKTIKTTATTTRSLEKNQQHLKGNGMVGIAPGGFHITILVVQNQQFYNKNLKFYCQHLSEANTPQCLPHFSLDLAEFLKSSCHWERLS